MKDPNNREMMRDFYRLYEKYETYPEGLAKEEVDPYWMKIGEDCDMFMTKWRGNKMAIYLSIALLGAREGEYREINHIRKTEV